MCDEFTKCETPLTLTIDLCKTCKHRIMEKDEDKVYIFYYPKKSLTGYKCDGYSHE